MNEIPQGVVRPLGELGGGLSSGSKGACRPTDAVGRERPVSGWSPIVCPL